MVAASLALGGCGDDDKDSSESSAKTTAGGAGTQSGLGSARYEALEAVYAAAVPLDQLDDDAPISEYNRVLENYGQKCEEELDAEDGLLAAYRRFCPLVADLREQLTAAGTCEDESQIEQCRAGIQGFRVVVRKVLREGERYDRVVEATQLSAACRKALVNPELSYEVMRGYGRAFAYLERALTTASQADAAKADALMTQAEARSERLPDARQALADFRSGCD